jgi:hypothetical protein
VEVRRRDRTIWFVVGAVIGALALAIVKPWGLGVSGGPSTPAGTLINVAESSRPSPSPSLPPGPVNCYNDEAFRLVTAERTLGKDIRSWIAVEPIPATEPGDPRIPTLSIVSGRLLGLGLCGPRSEGIEGRADESTVLWVPGGRSAQTGVMAMDLVRLDRLDEFGTGEGQLYKPPAGIAGPGRSWPNGRYLMELHRAGETSLWFAFRVASAPATPTPRGS